MASFIATRPGGNHPILHKHKPQQTFNPYVTLPIKKKGKQLIVGSMAIKSSNPPSPLFGKKGLLEPNQDSIFRERLDKWMEQSAEDIVRNIKQAPLLVQIHDDDKGSNPNLKTEKAILENWDAVKSEWENGECESPNGLIFVEEIEDDEAEIGVLGEEEVSKAWGIVVQGRGMECGPACYLLKTSRVRACLGMFCTHFCLMRVKSFNQSALDQFKDSWLSRGN